MDCIIIIIFDHSSKRKKSSVFVTRMAKSKKEARLVKTMEPIIRNICSPQCSENVWVFIWMQDTIHSVYYKWAMQQVEAGEESMYPIWRLRDVHKLGAAQALI